VRCGAQEELRFNLAYMSYLEKKLIAEFCLEVSPHLSLMDHAHESLAGHNSIHGSMSVPVKLLPLGFQSWLFQVAKSFPTYTMRPTTI
jgi:hypothetical protein